MTEELKIMCIPSVTVYEKYTESLTNEIVRERIEQEFNIHIVDTKWILGALFISFRAIDLALSINSLNIIYKCRCMISKIKTAQHIDERENNNHRFNINKRLDNAL